MSARILVLPGTMRPGAPDMRLAFEAARRLAVSSASVTLVDLADYPLPLLDIGETDAAEPPAAALQLAERIEAQDALLVVSPDANNSVPPLLKNAVDWAAGVSRADNRALRPFAGLVVGLASASPGRLGGFPVLAAWRPVLVALGAEVIAAEATVAGGVDAFDANGRLVDEAASARLEDFLASLLEKAQALGRHQI